MTCPNLRTIGTTAVLAGASGLACGVDERPHQVGAKNQAAAKEALDLLATYFLSKGKIDHTSDPNQKLTNVLNQLRSEDERLYDQVVSSARAGLEHIEAQNVAFVLIPLPDGGTVTHNRNDATGNALKLIDAHAKLFELNAATG